MDTEAGIATAITDGDAALASLQELLSGLTDGDLHRASPDGGWSVAQVVSHINVSAELWLGVLHRLACDPELAFVFREEVGHDALGYPPPTIEVAVAQLASTRRSLSTCLAAVEPAVLDREVEIPDLGTMAVRGWTPPIVGHVVGHVDQAREILVSRGVIPAGDRGGA